MKKEYLIGILTGCLLSASALMFMGATDGDSANGRYQLSSHPGVGGVGTVYSLLDTSNGQLYKRVTISKKWKKSGKPLQD